MTPSTIVYAATPKDKGNRAPRARCVCGVTLPVLWTDKFGKNMVTQTAWDNFGMTLVKFWYDFGVMLELGESIIGKKNEMFHEMGQNSSK